MNCCCCGLTFGDKLDTADLRGLAASAICCICKRPMHHTCGYVIDFPESSVRAVVQVGRLLQPLCVSVACRTGARLLSARIVDGPMTTINHVSIDRRKSFSRA